MSDFNLIAEQFSKTRAANWPFVDDLVKKYVKDGDSVLDLACGNGRLFPRIVQAGANYQGLDVSKELIAIAARDHPEGRFEIGNMINLPYGDQAFDLIFCIAGFHHLKTPELREQAVSEMRRVLKPGGLLVLTVWNLYQWRFLKYFWDSFLRTFRDREVKVKDVMIPWKDQKRRIQVERYYYALTSSELEKIFTQSGFNIVQSWQDTNLVLVASKR